MKYALLSITLMLILLLVGCTVTTPAAEPPQTPEPSPVPPEQTTPTPEPESVEPADIPPEPEEPAAETVEPVTGSESPQTEAGGSSLNYSIVDTGQVDCYNNTSKITPPEPGQAFYGQDAQYDGNQPVYRDNDDGTVTDLNTGLTWQQDPGDKMTYFDAVSGTDSFSLAGYDDWRLPTIKELYSLIIFSGTDPSGPGGASAVPFIDTDYFVFEYGDESAGERIIDSQFVSSTRYVSTTMGGDETVFGVNFADGRIKGYPIEMPGQPEGKLFYVLYVRGNPDYGENSFIDNGDGTITDSATGLMWSQTDSGEGMDWEEALAWVQQKNEENYLGYSDWRLPDAKELESIVDYTRSPDTTGSAAIDPMFEVTEIVNANGDIDYPYFWTGTTHIKNNGTGDSAVYISFGRGLGTMDGRNVIDVHGAGCQRSDPKTGNPEDYPTYFGPQGDERRVFNYVRCVRDAR